MNGHRIVCDWMASDACPLSVKMTLTPDKVIPLMAAINDAPLGAGKAAGRPWRRGPMVF